MRSFFSYYSVTRFHSVFKGEMTMFCPKCGTANNDTSNFCQNCSQPLTASRENLQNSLQSAPNSPASTFQPAQNAQPNQNYQSYQNAQPNQNFQANQNAGFQGGYNQSGPVKPRMKTWKMILLVLAGLFVAFFLIAAFSPDSPDSADGAGDATASADTDIAADEAAESAAASEESSSEASTDSSAENSGDSASTGNEGASEATAPENTTSASEQDAQDAPTFAEFMGKDVFDWNRASDKEKMDMAFQCQAYWQFSGITGEPVEMKSEDLVKKISEQMGEQDSVFSTACEVFGIDPTPWMEQAGN